MTQRILSIDIREDLVCGTLLSVSQRNVVVLNCCAAVLADRPVSDAVGEILLHVGYKDEPCRIAFGAEFFFFRNIDFPFGDKKKIEKIIPFELEENIAVPLESLLIDSLVTTKATKDATVIAAMIDRELVREHLEELAGLHLDPEIVAISHVQTALQLGRLQSLSDFVLLDIGCRRLTLIVMSEGRILLIRSMVFDDGSLAGFSLDKNSQMASARRVEAINATYSAICSAVEHTLFSLPQISSLLPIFITGTLAGIPDTSAFIEKKLGTDVKICNLVQPPIKVGLECRLWRDDLMTSALALGLRTGKKQLGFNFRKEEFVKKTSFVKYKKLIPRLGIPALVVLAVVVIYLWNGYLIKEKELKTLSDQNIALFKETLPDVTRITDAVKQLQIEIRELKKATLGDSKVQADIKILDLLAEVSVRIPPSLNVHVVRMVADRNGILVRGLTDNFNTVDNLKKVLEKSPYFDQVTISSANVATRESGIRFELKLQLSGG